MSRHSLLLWLCLWTAPWAQATPLNLEGYADASGAETFYAIPYKSDLKSLVWYSPDNFADAGYEVPQTYEDLKALTEKMVADSNTPWCIGLGSGGATGWPATVVPKSPRTAPETQWA